MQRSGVGTEMSAERIEAHVFDKAIALVASSRNCYTGKTSEAYLNMVGPFGGITAATMLNAVLKHPDCLGEPVSMTLNFAAAVEPGNFEIEALPIRTNRSTQHWHVIQRQGSQVTTSATVFCAIRKETWSEQELKAPDVHGPEKTTRLDTAGRREWLANYEFRFISGSYDPQKPESPKDSHSVLWIRDNPPRPLDFTSLAAMGDSFFPRLFTRTQRFFPAGTVSLTLYFHADSQEIAQSGTGYLLGTARANRSCKNYHDQTAHLWSSNGSLLLSTSQLMYYKLQEC